jgi:hypothetical protein
MVSGTKIEDAPSGFRAIHRDAALRMNVFSEYTYTLETIIQAGRKNMPIVAVPVKVNSYMRPSRLISSLPAYLARSAVTVIRIFIIYRPLRFFLLIALLPLIRALYFIFRFLLFYVSGNGGGHLQSLVLAAGLLVIAGVLAVTGVVADLIATNRLLLEDLRSRVLRAEIRGSSRKKMMSRAST